MTLEQEHRFGESSKHPLAGQAGRAGLRDLRE